MCLALGAAVLAVTVCASAQGAPLALPKPNQWADGPGGFWDGKVSAYYTNRILSATAKDVIYGEAVNAFRTHADDDGKWQGEYWGKTMLSAVCVAEMSRSPGLGEWIVTNALAFVKEFQQANGYLSSYSDENNVGPNEDGSEKFNWNLWGQKYTMWALLEIARMVEDDRSLQARLGRLGAGDAMVRLEAAATRMMEREIAWFEGTGAAMDKAGYFVGLPTMSVLKPLMILYRRTGRAEFLKFAGKIVGMWEREGNPPPNLIANAFGEKMVHEWYPNPGGWAKAYEMMSCLEGVLDYAAWTHDGRLVAAVARIAEKLRAAEGNPFGSVGYFDHFTHATAYPNATTELCDVIHWMRLVRDLFLATREAKYMDWYEVAYYNGLLPGLFRDGTWAAHGTRSHGTRQFVAPHQIGMKYHHCCVDNLCRAWRHAHESAAALDAANGTAYLNLYWRGNYIVGAGMDSITYRVQGGDYPYDGKLVTRVQSAKRRTLKFRAPGWADDFKVNGVGATNGWVTVRYDPKAPNGTWFTVTYAPRVEIHDWQTAPDADLGARLFEQTDVTPEMKGMSRTTGAAYLSLGPILLAKSSLVGDTKEQVFDFETILGKGYSCALEPIRGDQVYKAFRARFTKAGAATIEVNVQDFPSCDVNDEKGMYSIWF